MRKKENIKNCKDILEEICFLTLINKLTNKELKYFLDLYGVTKRKSYLSSSCLKYFSNNLLLNQKIYEKIQNSNIKHEYRDDFLVNYKDKNKKEIISFINSVQEENRIINLVSSKNYLLKLKDAIIKYNKKTTITKWFGLRSFLSLFFNSKIIKNKEIVKNLIDILNDFYIECDCNNMIIHLLFNRIIYTYEFYSDRNNNINYITQYSNNYNNYTKIKNKLLDEIMNRENKLMQGIFVYIVKTKALFDVYGKKYMEDLISKNYDKLYQHILKDIKIGNIIKTYINSSYDMKDYNEQIINMVNEEIYDLYEINNKQFFYCSPELYYYFNIIYCVNYDYNKDKFWPKEIEDKINNFTTIDDLYKKLSLITVDKELFKKFLLNNCDFYTQELLSLHKIEESIFLSTISGDLNYTYLIKIINFIHLYLKNLNYVHEDTITRIERQYYSKAMGKIESKLNSLVRNLNKFNFITCKQGMDNLINFLMNYDDEIFHFSTFLFNNIIDLLDKDKTIEEDQNKYCYLLSKYFEFYIDKYKIIGKELNIKNDLLSSLIVKLINLNYNNENDNILAKIFSFFKNERNDNLQILTKIYISHKTKIHNQFLKSKNASFKFSISVFYFYINNIKYNNLFKAINYFIQNTSQNNRYLLMYLYLLSILYISPYGYFVYINKSSIINKNFKNQFLDFKLFSEVDNSLSTISYKFKDLILDKNRSVTDFEMILKSKNNKTLITLDKLIESINCKFNIKIEYYNTFSEFNKKIYDKSFKGDILIFTKLKKDKFNVIDLKNNGINYNILSIFIENQNDCQYYLFNNKNQLWFDSYKNDYIHFKDINEVIKSYNKLYLIYYKHQDKKFSIISELFFNNMKASFIDSYFINDFFFYLEITNYDLKYNLIFIPFISVQTNFKEFYSFIQNNKKKKYEMLKFYKDTISGFLNICKHDILINNKMDKEEEKQVNKLINYINSL